MDPTEPVLRRTSSARWARVSAAAIAAMVLVSGCLADGRAPESGLLGAEQPGEKGLVVQVIDGDTLDVQLSDETTRRVRLPQIDTPEVDECGYREATAALAEIVRGESVRLIPTQSGPNLDDHGRLLRIAKVGSTDVGHLLVRSGFARWVPYFADEDPRLAAAYQEAERYARSEGAGLWAGPMAGTQGLRCWRVPLGPRAE